MSGDNYGKYENEMVAHCATIFDVTEKTLCLKSVFPIAFFGKYGNNELISCARNGI